ncbi:hypothetical protein WH52_02820 [Tenacibaculum holothuriorum]|uniref:Secretion system C-terminal sorting domain-containing protein n=1 Tax=Tenacibaculum holothuriorum TaxID=1635173 RepID=A0A1Y2PFV6_9FLAO|nr:T9SS type A sorting domain-containing protein [Tenacibaculum holothuriorum]OSY89050.1 hypothetical protein WH52_02820 [Tenacibaculum holothuriorum]
MKKIITISLLSLAFSLNAQVQKNAPWTNSNNLQKKGKTTFKDITKSAENYFKTIDKNKKGSGIKPFERWKYHWSFYTKPDGTLAPAEDLWSAWKQKKQMSLHQKNSNTSNWVSKGPYTHTNTASWSAGQGRVNVVAIDPSNQNTYYVGTPAGGIWKSTDAGLNWIPLTDNLPQIGVSGIAIHPTNSNIIYIATGDDDANDSYSVGVWKSIDGGSTWNNTGAIPGSPTDMSEIYINPNSTETVLVASSSGVHKTTNGGNTWVTKLNGDIEDIKMKPGDSSIWYATSNDTFYKSTDSGETFSAINIPTLTGSSRITMDVTPANSDYVYFVSAANDRSFNGLFKSTDSGTTFTKTSETNNIFESSQAWFDLALTVSSKNANIVYVGVLNIWKSINGGDSFSKINEWNQPNSASYTHADIHFLRFINDKFFAGTDGGVYVSNDEGSTFTSLTDNLAIGQFYRISVSPQNSNNIVGGLQDNGGYAHSDNTWNNYHGADGMDCVIKPNSPNNYFGFIQYGGSLYETKDGGKTRASFVSAPAEETGPNDSGGRWITPLVTDNDGVLYAGYKKLYKLLSNSWQAVTTSAFSGDISSIEIDPNNNNNIYVTVGTTLYKSIDRGITFNSIPLNTLSNINTFEVSNNDSNIGWLVLNNGVYKSTNLTSSSPTFTNITNNLPSESKTTIVHHLRSGNNTIYVGTTLGVYYTNDNLTEWKVFDTGLPNTMIRDLEVNEEDAQLYAATYGRGVFYTKIPEQLPNVDIKLESIENPTNGISCSSNITPKLIVKNKGTQTISSLTINYKYNNQSTQTQNWNGNITSLNTVTIELPTATLELGSQSLEIEVTTPNDTYNNNKRTINFNINKSSNTPTTINSFEGKNDVLLTDFTSNSGATKFWDVGPINKTLLQTPTGSKAYATSLSGNYPDKTTAYLYTNCYDLTKIANPVFKFNMGFDIEQDWDYLVVEYSKDQGKSWEILGTANDPNWYNSSSTLNNLPGKQWTGEGEDTNPQGGNNSTNREYSYDLNAFKNESNIVFRFKFLADDATNEEGVVIDDLVIAGTLSNNDPTVLNAISIFPNPSDDIFNLRWTTGDNLNIKVYDITGKQIFSKKDLNDSNYKLNMSNFAKGIYLLNMEMNGKSATKKLILK